MNFAKDFCDCIVSWEVQENRKISSVVHCSYSQTRNEKISSVDCSGTLYAKSSDESEMEFTPVVMMPFLHPELTKASFCDLKIFVSPKLGIKFDRLIIISTAKIAEFYDRTGELLYTAKGEKIIRKSDLKTKEDASSNKSSVATTSSKSGHNQKQPIRWFRKEYIPSVDTFEVLVRFSEHLIANQLQIKYIGVKVISYDWSPELSSFSTSPAGLLSSSSIGAIGGGGGGSGGGGSCASISSTGGLAITPAVVGGSMSGGVQSASDRIAEAVISLQSILQLLSSAASDLSAKGSNPQLGPGGNRRPNSPMASGTCSPFSAVMPQPSSSSSPKMNVSGTTISTGSSAIVTNNTISGCGDVSKRATVVVPPVVDIASLYTWLDSRLNKIEKNSQDGMTRLADRISNIETYLHLSTSSAEASSTITSTTTATIISANNNENEIKVIDSSPTKLREGNSDDVGFVLEDTSASGTRSHNDKWPTNSVTTANT